MTENPLSAKEKSNLKKVHLSPGDDFGDSRNRVGLINSDTGGVLRSYYNLDFNAQSRVIVEKTGGKTPPSGWEIAYSDASSYFEQLDLSGFTDHFSSWLDKSYSDPMVAAGTRANMASAACVGMAVILKALEVQLGEKFIERLEIAVSRDTKKVQDFFDKEKLNPKLALTPVSHGKRGRLPMHQSDLGIIVESLAEQATYGSCVMDGAVVTYKLIDSLWDDMVTGNEHEALEQSPQSNNSAVQPGRHLVVSIDEQAGVDAKQKHE